MIYIEYDKSGLVTHRHNKPFDEVDGLNETREELEKKGVLLEGVPKPEIIEGKAHIEYYDNIKKEFYYTYVDIPEAEDDKVTKLEQQVQQQNQAISELTMLIAISQTPLV